MKIIQTHARALRALRRSNYLEPLRELLYEKLARSRAVYEEVGSLEGQIRVATEHEVINALFNDEVEID